MWTVPGPMLIKLFFKCFSFVCLLYYFPRFIKALCLYFRIQIAREINWNLKMPHLYLWLLKFNFNLISVQPVQNLTVIPVDWVRIENGERPEVDHVIKPSLNFTNNESRLNFWSPNLSCTNKILYIWDGCIRWLRTVRLFILFYHVPPYCRVFYHGKTYIYWSDITIGNLIQLCLILFNPV